MSLYRSAKSFVRYYVPPPRALGIFGELRFWHRWMKTRGDAWPDEFGARFRARPLAPELAELARELGQASVRLLDVGSGPITSLGDVCEGVDIELVPTDVLADHYDRLLRFHGLAPPIRTVRADGERLLETFAPASFDLAHAKNSLDHATNPMLAIRQMVAVTRPGGTVFLQHAENEASAQGYHGLHQWNFTIRDDRFVLESREQLLDVQDELGTSGRVRAERRDDLICARIDVGASAR